MLAVLDAAGGENPYEFWRKPEGGTVRVYIPKGAPAVEIHPAGEYLTGGQFKVVDDRIVDDTPTRKGGRSITLEWVGPSPAADRWLDAQQAARNPNWLLPAVDYYRTSGVQALQHAVKDGDASAAYRMAVQMAPNVPDDAVLIPMPSHLGSGGAGPLLTRYLAELTGRPVADVLRGTHRRSLYEAKKEGVDPASIDLGLTVTGPIPDGTPVVVDNVVGSGHSARSALAVLPPGARMLVHAVDRDALGAAQADLSTTPPEADSPPLGGSGASLPPSGIPADVAVKRNRVANIDTDRLIRRRQWIVDRFNREDTHAPVIPGGRLGAGYRAVELRAIETELEARDVSFDRFTMTDDQLAALADGTLRASRIVATPTVDRPLDVDLSSISRSGKPAQWKMAGGANNTPVKVSGTYSRATVNARMKAVRSLMEDELPQLKGRDFTIDYWLDWDEYRAAVSPDETGGYPMAQWDEANNRVIISPSIATGLFDEGSEETWRTVMHELVHAASPQNVPNSGPEPIMEEGMAEILSLDIGARRVADFGRLRSSGYAGGGRGETGLETLARNAVYKDRVAALILNAGERSGWDRQATMATLRDWWESGSYQTFHRKVEYRSDGLDGEALRAKRREEINRQYDDLIRRVPQHADEYEADRRRELADVDAGITDGDVTFRARQLWDELTGSARAAGVNLDRIRIDWTSDAGFFDESGRTAADVSVEETVAASLVYWLLSGEQSDTARGESGL
jgi:hypothetical protein